MSELSSSDESTNKVPRVAQHDEAATTQHRRQMPAIPSILKRDDLSSPSASAAGAKADFSWPLASTKPREPGPWKPPASPRPSRPSMPSLGPAPRARSDSAMPRPVGKIDIPSLPSIVAKPVAATPIARVMPIPAPVVEAPAPVATVAPVVEAAPEPMPAPVAAAAMPAPAVEAPPFVEPVAIAESSGPVVAPAAAPRARGAKRGNNVRRQRIPREASPEAAAVSEPIPQAPAFGAGMLQARSGRTKRPTPAPVVESAPMAEMPTTFGSGMLKSRGAKKAARAAVAPAAPVAEMSAQHSFGAGMLHARKGRGKLVVGLIVAAVIAVGVGFALNSGSSSHAAAAATQKT